MAKAPILNTKETPIKLDYQLKKGCIGSKIIVKLPRMRKEKSFCIYPIGRDEKNIWIQSDNSCACISRETGFTVYTNKGSAPMDFYIMFKPTYACYLDLQIVKDIENEVNGNRQYNGNTVIMDMCL